MSYFLKNKDIPKNFSCIYKINYPNGKIYIGRTWDLKRRSYEHNNKNPKQVCDFAIKKYGKIQEWEILEDNFNDENDMYEKEIYWINFYSSNDRAIGYNIESGGASGYKNNEENLNSVFKNEDVLEIRKRKFYGERKREVYKDFSNIKFTTFSNIWEGRGYSNIGKKYITQQNNYEPYSGSYNKTTSLNENIVKEIRLKYKNGLTQKELLEEYPNIPQTTMNNIIHFKSWKYTEKDLKVDKFRGKKVITEEIVKQIKQSVVEGLELKDIKEKFQEYNLKEINKIVKGEAYQNIYIENFVPRVKKKSISNETKEKIKEEIQKGKEIEYICKTFKVSRSTFYRLKKDLNQN